MKIGLVDRIAEVLSTNTSGGRLWRKLPWEANRFLCSLWMLAGALHAVDRDCYILGSCFVRGSLHRRLRPAYWAFRNYLFFFDSFCIPELYEPSHKMLCPTGIDLAWPVGRPRWSRCDLPNLGFSDKSYSWNYLRSRFRFGATKSAVFSQSRISIIKSSTVLVGLTVLWCSGHLYALHCLNTAEAHLAFGRVSESQSIPPCWNDTCIC